MVIDIFRSRISAYLQRISHSTATLDVKNIAEFKTSDEIVFITYIESPDATLTYNFNILATRHKDKFTFGTADQSLAVNEGVSPGCVVRYMDSEEPQSICGEWKLDVLESFVGLVTAPMVGEITRGNELKYLRVGVLSYRLSIRANIVLLVRKITCLSVWRNGGGKKRV